VLAALRCRPAHGTQSDSRLDLHHPLGRRLPPTCPSRTARVCRASAWCG